MRREGLYDFRVVCDLTNNTPDVIDRNEMPVDFYVKPARDAEFIPYTIVVTSTDVVLPTT
jgi:phage tail sheath protein FI